MTDPNGRYYLVKNYHDGYPPALDFPFHVRYDSAAMPSGVCKLYSDDLEPIILKSTTPAVSTTQTTTPKQTTPPVTTQKQTTPPATTSQSTPAVTTSKPGKCLDNVYLLYPSDI